MKTFLNIFDVTVTIESELTIINWVEYDYAQYVSKRTTPNPDLSFKLTQDKGNRQVFYGLLAKTYHQDYIIYEKGHLRIIDFFGEAFSVFNKKTKETEVYCPDINYLYEIFYLAFESLAGEELEKKGYARIHCLALEKNGKVSILMLPPGGGKTTLALDFLKHPAIKVLTEDILLFKRGQFYGLHFRWGVRRKNYGGPQPSRLMKRRREHDKFLLNSVNFSLADSATYGNLIVGVRVLDDKSSIKPATKLFLFWRMFKPMVLGLELQQSLAYFLVGGFSDYLKKIKLLAKRLLNISLIIFHSQTFTAFLGNETANNFQTLSRFIEHKN